MTDLTTLSIAEAGRLMARGELTSTELTDAFLKRIEAVDHKIASYITVTADVARSAARQADMEMQGGVRRGPLHGIPIALKDIYETAGVRTTGHSHLQRRLRAGDRRRDGAAPQGRAARSSWASSRTHEFANGAMTPDQPFPPARNPWNTELPARRLVERLGRGGGGRALHGRDRLRHRRLDPQSGGLLRHGRHQADLRPGEPLRHLPAVASASTPPGRWPGRSRTAR